MYRVARQIETTREMLSLGSKAAHQNASVADLEARVDRQALIIQTLLMILLEKKVIHDDEFREWLGYVDGMDGAADGRLREDRSPRACPSCTRMNRFGSAKCQYCGAEMEFDYIQHRRDGAGPGDPSI